MANMPIGKSEGGMLTVMIVLVIAIVNLVLGYLTAKKLWWRGGSSS